MGRRTAYLSVGNERRDERGQGGVNFLVSAHQWCHHRHHHHHSSQFFVTQPNINWLAQRPSRKYLGSPFGAYPNSLSHWPRPEQRLPTRKLFATVGQVYALHSKFY